MALPRSARVLVVAGLLLVAGGALAAWLWPEPPPEPEPGDSDTGLNRQQVEDLMRTIGYVQ